MSKKEVYKEILKDHPKYITQKCLLDDDIDKHFCNIKQTNLDGVKPSDCNYRCIVGDVCEEQRACINAKVINSKINARYNTNKNKALYTYFIDPPLEKDIKKLFYDFLIGDHKCTYCGGLMDIYATRENVKSSVSLDHKIPISAKGTNKLDNLQLICHRCNIVKEHTHPDHFATVCKCLINNYGTEGLSNFLDTLYEVMFASFCSTKREGGN
jgi:5-methylcytosine-specific restriction endonuclease McrA